MNPTKVPAALDPFGWVWKHYTHPKSVQVKKFKITWPPWIFSIFPFWSEFWLQSYLLEVAWGGDKSFKFRNMSWNESEQSSGCPRSSWMSLREFHASRNCTREKIQNYMTIFDFFKFSILEPILATCSLLLFLIRKAWKMCLKCFLKFFHSFWTTWSSKMILIIIWKYQRTI